LTGISLQFRIDLSRELTEARACKLIPAGGRFRQLIDGLAIVFNGGPKADEHLRPLCQRTADSRFLIVHADQRIDGHDSSHQQQREKRRAHGKDQSPHTPER